MTNFVAEILRLIPEYQQVFTCIDSGKSPVAVSGISAIHRAQIASVLYEQLGFNLVLVCADESEALRMRSDISFFSNTDPMLIGAREFLFHPSATSSHQWEHKRIQAMYQLLGLQEPSIIIVTAEALLQRTIPPALFKEKTFTISENDTIKLDDLTLFLTNTGYTRSEQVEGIGQFSVRGGIIDFYSPAHAQPVRIELWGDEIDSMSLFDIESQRRTESLSHAVILPTAEVVSTDNSNALSVNCDLALPRLYKEVSTLLDFLPNDSIFLFSESNRIAERSKNYQWQIEEDVKALIDAGQLDSKYSNFVLSWESFCSKLAVYPLVYLDSFPYSSYPIRPLAIIPMIAKQLPSFGQSLETAISDLNHYQSQGFSTVILVGGQQRALSLQSMLQDRGISVGVNYSLHDLPAGGQVIISIGNISAGFEYTEAKIAVLTESTSAPPKKRIARKKESNRQKLNSYADLSPGDLVVHELHGIGRYLGMEKIVTDKVEKDYVKIAYAGTDTLYVPITQLDLVSKYIGSGENTEGKKLSKLGGTDWNKAKSRTRKAVQDLAKGLIQLYAARQRQPGFAFSPDSPWQREFEDQFEYAETQDQLRCIDEIKLDMEQPRPMDRILCGDVGYGKTEVAFRAIMKCILDNKQAAILVPTTVLARQHYFTAIKRFQNFPVRIEMVSRFRTPAETKRIVQQLKEGTIDLLIGTHKLFQKDIEFKDLGLLVVDEEQRFGVTHKENLKEKFSQVDVLTLSATPIPRTLNMALSGIRDMSTLEEPPQDRQPVQTYVLEHDWSVIGDAMRRELERGGQIYYLHNHIETIARTANRIREILGENVSIAIAHGKMSESEIGEVMTAMTEGEVDVLVCTTIIETGIDISNVNTLIIEDADHMGLAQLHQIRGRVGRSSRRAYAYLTYRKGKVLSEIATKRLQAIHDFAEFGSGFKIAMRDLEIRGAGNILGPEQSGFLISVGYDMYLKLLEEAVLLEQGLPLPTSQDCSVDLSVPAAIPDRYVSSAEHRMDLYRRIAHIRTEQDADDIVDELIDRFGDPPKSVNNLVSIALLRSSAIQCDVSDITQKGTSVLFYVRNAQSQFHNIATLCASSNYKGRLLFSAGDKPYLALRLKSNDNPLTLSSKLISDYLKLINSKNMEKV